MLLDIPHPALFGWPSALMSQLEVSIFPVNILLFVIVHPEEVCKVIKFVVWAFTPSIMSISPLNDLAYVFVELHCLTCI